MTRLERMSAMLIRLQTKRVMPARELARKFDVSLRTVYRDIRSLEEAGVPLGADAGSGYFLVEGYSLPPVAFTAGEAAALITAGKFMGALADESVRKQYESAVSKVLCVMPQKLKDAAETLDGRMDVYSAPAVPPQAPHMADIQAAICGSRVLRIRYAPPSRESETRDVEPLMLFFYDMRWFLYAWCRLRRAYRSFRTDRILMLSVLGGSFDGSAHEKAMKAARGTLVTGHDRDAMRQTTDK